MNEERSITASDRPGRITSGGAAALRVCVGVPHVHRAPPHNGQPGEDPSTTTPCGASLLRHRR